MVPDKRRHIPFRSAFRVKGTFLGKVPVKEKVLSTQKVPFVLEVPAKEKVPIEMKVPTTINLDCKN